MGKFSFSHYVEGGGICYEASSKDVMVADGICYDVVLTLNDQCIVKEDGVGLLCYVTKLMDDGSIRWFSLKDKVVI